MADNDKTRVLQNTDTMKTRLIRNNQPNPENDDRAKVRLPQAQEFANVEQKTRLAGRPQTNTNKQQQNIIDEDVRPIVGWLVVMRGKGQGKYSPIFDGMNSIGRGDNQSTQVDFGDETISREEHAFLTYDLKSRKFYLSHGGKSNIVRCNGAPVLQVIELTDRDKIIIGETEFIFVSFCGDKFDWADVKE